MSDVERTGVSLVEFIAKSIVKDPDAVEAHCPDGGSVIELETAPDDRGRVIGRQGRVAKAMRAVLQASRSASRQHLEIVD